MENTEPSALLSRAAKLYIDGEYAKGYANNRLATHILETRFNNYSQAVSSAIFCLSALRPLRRSDLIRYIVNEVQRLCATARGLSPFWKGEFLSKLALVVFDYGLPKLAFPLLALAEQEIGLATDAIDHESLELRRSRATKHHAWMLGCLADSQKDRGRALGQIDDSMQIAMQFRNDQAIGSAQLASAIVHVGAGNFKKCLKHVEAGLCREPYNDALTAAQLYAMRGAVMAELGERRHASVALTTAAGLYAKHGLYPDPFPINGHFGGVNPLRELQRLGIVEAPSAALVGVLEIAGASMKPMLDLAPPCPLTEAELGQIVRAISEA